MHTKFEPTKAAKELKGSEAADKMRTLADEYDEVSVKLEALLITPFLIMPLLNDVE